MVNKSFDHRPISKGANINYLWLWIRRDLLWKYAGFKNKVLGVVATNVAKLGPLFIFKILFLMLISQC
jgi:hypothetical protein